jgi:hypothetical protein
MLPFYIALAIGCVAFWRVALKLLMIVAVFLLIYGIVMVVQDVQHVVR